jgi:hypothetical protein
MEEISSQFSSQAVPWLIIATFSQVYSENCKQIAEWKIWKTFILLEKKHIKLYTKKCDYWRN